MDRAPDLTVIFVTHNVREAVRLGDRVVLLSSRPGRVAARVHRSTSRGPGASTPPRSPTSPPRSPTGSGRRCAAMATTTDRPSRRRSSRARRPRRARARGRPGPSRVVAHLGRDVAEARRDRDRAARSGSASCGRVGSPTTCSPARRRSSRCSGSNFDTYVDGARSRRSSGPSSASRIAVVIGTALGALIARSRILRSGGRLDDHRPHDDAVDRVVPGRDRAVRASPRRRSSSSSSSARRRRSPTASSPASTTSRRSCSGPARVLGAKGWTSFRHVVLPAALPTVRRRAQAGLGVRVAQPAGRRAARADRRARRRSAASSTQLGQLRRLRGRSTPR